MENIRKFTKSRAGKVAMALILAPMAFLGMSPSSNGPSGDTVAQVGNVKLLSAQLDNEVTKQRNMLIQAGMNKKDIEESVLSEQALQSLINNELLRQQVSKLGIGVSDSSITKLLKNYPEFMDANGKFSNEKFAMIMRQNNLSKEQLFAMERQRLSIQQLANGIVSTSIYPMSEIEKVIDLELESRNVWLHRIPWQNFRDQVTVSDNDIKEYYDKNAQSFQSVPMVDLSYLKVDTSLIVVDAESITEEDISKQYDDFLVKNNFKDVREFSQILLTSEGAEKLSKEIKTKLTNGEDFAKLAKEFSEDESAKNGGQLGKFDPAMFGDDGKKMQTALADLKLNEVSEPIKNSFGYQIFQVTADSSDKVPTLESMRAELTAKATDYKAKLLLADKITAINDMASNGFAIEDIAKQANLKVSKIADYQKYDNLSDLAQPEIMKAAFNEFNIQSMSVSTGIDVEGDAEAKTDSITFWIQSNNYRATTQLTADEVKNDIKAMIEKQKSIDLAVEYANSKALEVTTEESIEKLGLDFTPLKNVTRKDPLLTKNEQLVTFSKKSDANKLVAIVTDTQDGASLIVADKIQSSLSPQLPIVQKNKLASQIRDNFGQNHLLDYLDYLNTEIGVVMPEEAKK